RLILSAVVLGWVTYLRPVSLYLGFWLFPVLLFLPRILSWRQRIARAVLFPLIFILTLVPWILRNAAVADYKAFSATPDLDLYGYVAAAVEAKLEHRSFIQMQKEKGLDAYFWSAAAVDVDSVHKSFAWMDEDSERSKQPRYFQIHPEQRAWSQGKVIRF